MSIIDQLEKTVTPAILGEYDSSTSMAKMSLLEQFYAILASRLATPHVYSQLLRADPVLANNATETPLFEQLWPDPKWQQTIIQSFAAEHHIDAATTLQLINNAAPLVYQELKILANGQFLPAFLQAEQKTLRPYLPLWSAPIITAMAASQEVGHPALSTMNENNHALPIENSVVNEVNKPDLTTPAIAAIASTGMVDTEKVAVEQSVTEKPAWEKDNRDGIATDQTNTVSDGQSLTHHSGMASTETVTNNGIVNRDTSSNGIAGDAIHANPSAYYAAENSSMKHEQVRTRNQRNDLLVRVFLLVLAIAAMALAAWALLIKPNNQSSVESVAVTPTAPPPIPEPSVPTLTPTEFIVGVDDSGNLYTCSAVVGDVALQSALQQALNTSFGEQASICELTIKEGVATSMANMSMDILPNVLTMLRTTPFARLQLQNERLTLEAPDSMQLQQLTTNVRNLAPTMLIDSTAPLPLSNNATTNSNFGPEEGSALNNQVNNGMESDGQYNNNMNSNSPEYQASDDETDDRVIPAPLPNNTPLPNNNRFNNNEFNNPANNRASTAPSNLNNTLNSAPSNNRAARPPGPFSESEVDDMASTVIVAEPAQVR